MIPQRRSLRLCKCSARSNDAFDKPVSADHCNHGRSGNRDPRAKPWFIPESDTGPQKRNGNDGYTRSAKALIAVGDGGDRSPGRETEFAPLSNPHADELKDGVQVQQL